MMRFKSMIEDRAREASKVTSYDDERKEAFIDGAIFAIDELARMVMPDHYDTLMDKGILEYVDKLRLNDVREGWIEKAIKKEAKHDSANCDNESGSFLSHQLSAIREKSFTTGAHFAADLVARRCLEILRSEKTKKACPGPHDGSDYAEWIERELRVEGLLK